MVDFIPFTGLAATDNNTQYQANSVVTTANAGTVIAATSMVIVPATGYVGIGTTNPLSNLDIRGNASATGSLNVGGATTLNSLIVNTSVTSGSFNIIGALQAGTINSNTTIQSAGTTTANVLISNTTIQSAGTTTVNALISNVYGLFGQNVTVNSTNASTTTTNGALVVAGGIGVGGNINVGGSRSLFTGAIGVGTSTAAGMIANVGVSNDAYVWGNVRISNTNSTSSGVIFPDGTIQTSAAAPSSATLSYGLNGTVQFANTSNTFLGDSTNFFWDNSNKRLGIGTSTPSTVMSVYGDTPALFNTRTGGGTRQEIFVSHSTSTSNGAVLGNDGSVGIYGGYGYLRRGESSVGSPAISFTYVLANHRVGINGVTQPQNALDVSGAVAIGNSYSGLAALTNTNGMSVQGRVGIGTFTPIANNNILTLFAATGAGIELVSGGASAGGGNIQTFSGGGLVFSTFTGGVAAESYTERMRIDSNGDVGLGVADPLSTLDVGGIASFRSAVSVAGATAVSSLIANTNITTGTLNATSSVIVANLNSNTNVVGTNLQSTGQATVASLVSNTNIFGATLNTSGAVVVGSLTSNTTIQSNGAAVFNNFTANTRSFITSGGMSITGDSTISGNLTVTGNLTLSGNTTVVNVQSLTIVDPVIELGIGTGGTALTVDDGQDRGMLLDYYHSPGYYGETAGFNHAFVGYNNSTGRLIYVTNVAPGNINVNNDIESYLGIIYGGATFGNIWLSNNIVSTNTTSGGVVAIGGIGAGGNINVGGQLSTFAGNIVVNGTNASISPATGAITVTGGVGVTGNINAGGNVFVGATLTAAGQAIVANVYSNGFVQGGAFTAASLNSNGTIVGSNIYSNGFVQSAGTSTVNTLVSNVYGLFGQNVTVNSTNASTSTTNGALIVAGGAGITGNINVGGSRSLFTNSVGIGTSTATGVNSNVFAVYGTQMLYGNLDLGSTAAGGAGIYFADGTFQISAAGSTTPYGNTNVASYLSGPVQVGNLTISNTTASTSTTTGALLMGGGAGIQGNVNIGGNLSVALASQLSFVIASNSIVGSSMTSNGIIQAAGTITAANIVSNGDVKTTTLNTTSTATVAGLNSNAQVQAVGAVTAAYINSNGTIVGANIYSNGFVQTTGTATVNALVSNVYGVFGQNVTVRSANASTSTATGALIVTTGGAGIAGNIYAGGNIVLNSTGATVTQVWASANDSAAQPGYAWSGDTAAGMFQAAANTIGFTTVGVERARITNIGNLLVGTTATTLGSNSTVVISGLGTNGGGIELVGGGQSGGGNISALSGGGINFGTFTGAVGAEAYTERARFVPNGNLLIGTRVNPAGGNATVVIQGVGTNGGGAEFVGASGSGGGNISAMSGGGLTFSTFTGAVGSEVYTDRMRLNTTSNILINTALNPLGGNATVVISGLGTNGGGIELVGGGQTGGGNISAMTAGGMTFGTFTGVVGAESYAERMRIEPTGNVGIGTTTSSNARVTIETANAGVSTGTIALLLQTRQGGTGTYVDLAAATYNGFTSATSSTIRFIDDNNFSNNIAFRTKLGGAATNADVERMRIYSTGNIGIGTSTAPLGGNATVVVGGIGTNGGGIELVGGSTSGGANISGMSAGGLTISTFTGLVGAEVYTNRMIVNNAGNLLINTALNPLGGNATVVVGGIGTNGGGIELVGSTTGGGNISGMGNGGLTFSTFTGAVGSEVYANRMRITALGNIGIGTATVGTGNTVAVFGGNIYVGSTNSGIVFADGTYQSTAYGTSASGVTSFAAGTTGMTPTAATTGAVTLAFGTSATAQGIYSPTANQIALSTASTARLLINANGNVLVGTTTAPSDGNATVVIQGLGTNGGGLQLSGGTAGGTIQEAVNGGGTYWNTYTGAIGSEAITERMRILGGGNLLIGTSLAPLGSNATVVISGLGTNGGGIELVGGGQTGGGNISAMTAGGMTFGTFTGTVGAEVYTERMRLAAGGKLLVGTTIAPVGAATNLFLNASTGSGVQFGNNNTSGSNISVGFGNGIVFSSYTGVGGSETYTQRAMISGLTGNLLIGTTALPAGGNATVVVAGVGTNGGGIELVGSTTGGGNISGMGNGGLTISTFTGAVGSEVYTNRMVVNNAGNLLINTALNPLGGNATVVVGGIGTNGGGIELVGGGASGGGNISALAAGGLTVGTFTGAVGAESYAERMRIASDGNIGVNTATTTNAKFSIVGGTGSAGELYLNAGTNFIRMGSSLSGGSYNSLVQAGDQALIFSGGTQTTTGALVIGPWTALTQVGLRMPAGGNLLIGTATSPLTSTAVQVINSTNGGGTEWVNNNSGGGNVSAISAGGLAFGTFTGAVGAEVVTERMRLAANGKFLVGTTIAPVGAATNLFLNASTGGGVQFGNNNTSGSNISVGFGNGIVFSSYTGVGGSETYTQRAMISGLTGNLLIGTTALPAGGNATVVVAGVGTNGGGIELVGSTTGGGNISGMGNGGLTFSTFTGAVGSEVYADRMRITALGNIGIGTATVGTGNTVAVFGGNIYVGSTNSGIVFADGTYQSTAYGTSTSGVTSFAAGTTGMTPTAATTGAVTLAFGTSATAQGIYSPTTNQIALSTASTARLLINANGNVLVGTTTAPAGGNATVVLEGLGTNGGGIELIGGSASGGGLVSGLSAGGMAFATFTGVPGSEVYTERMRIDVNGNVGIGTATVSTGNIFAVYGRSFHAGNVQIANTAVGGAGIFFPDGSYQSTAATGSGGVTSFSGGTTGFTPAVLTTGSITLGGTLIAANGGTGFNTYVVGDILYASTTTVLSRLADVATGQVLVSGGVGVAPTYSSTPTLTSLTAATLRGGTAAGSSLTLQSTSGAGTTDSIVLKVGNAGAISALSIATTGVITLSSALPAGSGGTGQSTYVIGDILYASTTSALSRLADVATGQVLVSGGVGVAPAWSSGPTTATHVLNNATGPQLTFSGATSNFINFGTVGDAAPAFTTRSVGTKIVYESNITAISVDYAVGVVNTSTTAPLSTAPGTLWHSVPAANILHRFQWYGGTTALATLWGNGNLAVTGEVTAYFSDVRLKDNVVIISDAVHKVKQIRGVYYHASDAAVELLGEDKTVQKVGLLAQEVEAILPNVIRPAPFDVGSDGLSKSGENYLTLQYERVIPLLVQAIKEQQTQIEAQQVQIDSLLARITRLEPKP